MMKTLKKFQYAVAAFLLTVLAAQAAVIAGVVSPVVTFPASTFVRPPVYGHDGRLYAVQSTGTAIFSAAADGSSALVKEDIPAAYTVALGNNNGVAAPVVNSSGQIIYGVGQTNSTGQACPRTVLLTKVTHYGKLLIYTPWAATDKWQAVSGETLGQDICPVSSMAIDKDDNVYFISATLAATGKHIIYRLSADHSALSVVKEFAVNANAGPDLVAKQATEGYTPSALSIGADGTTLYIATSAGGANNLGTLSRIDTTNAGLPYEVLRTVTSTDEGGAILPYTTYAPTLAQAGSRLYYAARTGGTHTVSGQKQGSLNSIDLSAADVNASFRLEYDFTGGTDGYLGFGLGLYSLQGTLYGVVPGNSPIGVGGTAGAHGQGYLFTFASGDATPTNLRDFIHTDAVGGVPVPALAKGLDGNLYGTTQYGQPGGTDGAEMKWWRYDTGSTAPAITAFYPEDASLFYDGEVLKTRLHWKASNATACTASGDWSGAQPAASAAEGVEVAVPEGTSEYTLSCGEGESAVSRTVRVRASGELPPLAAIGSFTVSPATLKTGERFTLNWATSDAASCKVLNAGGSTVYTLLPEELAGGTRTQADFSSPTAGTYTYTLSCTGRGGNVVTAPLSVTVETAVVNSTEGGGGGGSFSPFMLLPFALLALRCRKA